MKKFLLVLVTCFFSVLFFSTANANLITNGSFEEGDYKGDSNFQTLYATNNSINAWTITAGSVDWINTYWTASDGRYSLDMGGYTQGTILQNSISTVAGQEYLLTFDMAGNPDNGPTVKTMDVVVNGVTTGFTFDTTGKTRSAMGWVSNSILFTADSALTGITFKSTSSQQGQQYPEAYGPALDNVQLNPVPEPATMLLLGSGLVGLGGFRKRFFKK